MCIRDRIHEWVDEITARQDESFVVLCHTHGRSTQVAYILQQEGHPNVRVLRDGMLNWSKSGLPHVTWNG